MKMKQFVSGAVLAISFGFSTGNAYAAEVNEELAADPEAALAELENIGTPLSQEEAAQIGGGKFSWETFVWNRVRSTVYGQVLNGVASSLGSSVRFTLGAPLTACAPTIGNPCR